MRKLVEVTFMSLDGVTDAPDLVQQAQQYFSPGDGHLSFQYQKNRLFEADALLLGRKTYEHLSKAYEEMAKTGKGAPVDFVSRMNSVPKYIASTTLKQTTWNASVIQGDVVEEIRKIKNQPGKDIVKYGTGMLDRILFGQRLVDLLCITVYPFVLGHGARLFEELEHPLHFEVSGVQRFDDGTMAIEYIPKG